MTWCLIKHSNKSAFVVHTVTTLLPNDVVPGVSSPQRHNTKVTPQSDPQYSTAIAYHVRSRMSKEGNRVDVWFMGIIFYCLRMTTKTERTLQDDITLYTQEKVLDRQQER
jgi:hypothetical protein